MSRLFFLIIRERYRRCRHFIKKKPITAVGLVVSGISLIYMLIDALCHSFYVSEYLNNQIVIFAIMAYMIGKIMNPTQGMTIDYQLLELKLITLTQFKVLIGIKLLGGSVVFSLICLNSYTEVVAIVSALNAMVNIWIFLRNRWNSRVYDLFVTGAVLICVKLQLLYLSVLCMGIMLGIYIMLERVNYESLLPLYKLIYKATQQRYMGAVYTAKETREIEVSAETLIGKPKEKNSDWCEKLYERNICFEMCKEVARVLANDNKLIAYFIISVMIGISRFYIPTGYQFMVFVLLVLVLVSFDFSMNRTEANLLMRGFIRKYNVSDIIKNKVLVYSAANFILMLPSVFLGWKWLLLAVICSCAIALITLYKCFCIRYR